MRSSIRSNERICFSSRAWATGDEDAVRASMRATAARPVAVSCGRRRSVVAPDRPCVRPACGGRARSWPPRSGPGRRRGRGRADVADAASPHVAQDAGRQRGEAPPARRLPPCRAPTTRPSRKSASPIASDSSGGPHVPRSSRSSTPIVAASDASPDKDASPHVVASDQPMRVNSIVRATGSAATRLHPHGVAGLDARWRDTRAITAGSTQLDDDATLVLVDDDGVEHVADPCRQQHRLGEVDHRPIDAVGPLLALGHRRRQVRRTPPCTSSGDGPTVGDRQASPRPRSGRRGGAAAPWRGRRSPPSPRATASRPSAYGSYDAPPPARRTAIRNAAARGSSVGSERWKSASDCAAGQSSPNARGGAAQPARRRRSVGLGHHAEQPGAGGEQRVGDGQVGGQRHAGVVVLARPGGGRSAAPSGRRPRSSSCSGNSTRGAPGRSSAAVDAAGQLAKLRRQVGRLDGRRRPAWPGCAPAPARRRRGGRPRPRRPGP